MPCSHESAYMEESKKKMFKTFCGDKYTEVQLYSVQTCVLNNTTSVQPWFDLYVFSLSPRCPSGNFGEDLN